MLTRKLKLESVEQPYSPKTKARASSIVSDARTLSSRRARKSASSNAANAATSATDRIAQTTVPVVPAAKAKSAINSNATPANSKTPRQSRGRII